jgi:hypothetical protein
MGVVVGLDFGVRDHGWSGGEVGCVEADEADLAGFGDGVGVAGGVLLEEVLKVGVGGVDGGLDVGGGDDGVVEFDLGAGLEIVRLDGAV